VKSSFLWIMCVAFVLLLMEVGKAGAVAERQAEISCFFTRFGDVPAFMVQYLVSEAVMLRWSIWRFCAVADGGGQARAIAERHLSKRAVLHG
jgi:hypothetical protein